LIRVYRWRRGGRIAGVLETPDGAKQKPFRSFDELRQAMGAVLIEDASGTRPGRKP
jgi:hypothetical protein